MKYDELTRYARHLSLSEIGRAGQEKLQRSRVLMVGAGGLGASALPFLSAAGIGTLAIADDDRISLSNLQRQTLYEEADIHRHKVDAAIDRLSEINSQTTLIGIKERLTPENAVEHIQNYDIILDGSDNFDTRFLLNRLCLSHKIPLISAAIQTFSGQLYCFTPYLGEDHPCYECLYPRDVPTDAIPDCSENGIFGPLAGIMGSWQAAEAIKELLQIGTRLSGYMVRMNLLTHEISRAKLPKDPACPCCQPII